jgi:hypothetical protein
MSTLLMTDLEQELNLRLEQAHQTCTLDSTSKECAVAWDVVEELHAAIADRKQPQKSALEVFCDTHPDDAECRIYEI